MTEFSQKLKKKQTDDNMKLYKKFRNRVSNELKESKGRYFYNYISTNSQKMLILTSGKWAVSASASHVLQVDLTAEESALGPFA